MAKYHNVKPVASALCQNSLRTSWPFCLSLHYWILFLPSSVQVMQVVNADAIVVKLNSGEYKTIHLSSIRPPRLEGEVRVNACLSLDIPVTKTITESTGCAGCLLHCLQSADVKVFSPLHLLKAPISYLHASFTFRSQSSVFSGHQGELETEAHQPRPPPPPLSLWHTSAALQPKAL